MGAQRKLAEPTPATPLEDAAPVERADYRSPRTAGGELPTSPAVLLQEQLAARIAEASTGPAEAADTVEVRKWPMPLRIATIVGLSVALWGGIFLATAAIVT